MVTQDMARLYSCWRSLVEAGGLCVQEEILGLLMDHSISDRELNMTLKVPPERKECRISCATHHCLPRAVLCIFCVPMPADVRLMTPPDEVGGFQEKLTCEHLGMLFEYNPGENTSPVRVAFSLLRP